MTETAAPAAATETAPPPAVETAAAPAATGYQWPADLDGDLKGVLERTKWSDPVDVLKGYRNAEKLVSGPKVPLPAGPDDREGHARIYDALGRPKDATGYDLTVDGLPDGMPVNEGLLDGFKVKAHEIGLTGQQAKALASWMLGEVNGAAWKEHQASIAEAEKRTEDAMRAKYGARYDETLTLAERAAASRGYADADWKQWLPVFAELGTLTAEHKPAGLGGGGAAVKTAQQQIDALSTDKSFYEAMQGKAGPLAKANAQARWRALNDQAAAEAAASS